MATIVNEEALDSPTNSPNSASQLDLTGLSVNTTALNHAVDSILLGQPVHGEDDNYSYTATVLDMDQLDLDSLTSLMTPHRLSSIYHHGDLILDSDYPPLPNLPHNLEITPVSASAQHLADLTPTVNRGYSFSFTEDLNSSSHVPITLDTTNLDTIKTVSTLPAVLSPSNDNSIVESWSPPGNSCGQAVCDSEGRPNKRSRREPSRFRDFTSPTIR